MIVAVAENSVIGKDNSLIWHLPADMKFFKEKTSGHAIISGRKNYESIPEKFRPLPNRTNIVITRNKDFKEEGIIIVNSIEEAVNYANQHTDKDEIFIIGGAEIFKQSLHLCTRVYLTRIHHSFEGDVFFRFDNNGWKLADSREFKADEKNKYDMTFETWEQ